MISNQRIKLINCIIVKSSFARNIYLNTWIHWIGQEISYDVFFSSEKWKVQLGRLTPQIIRNKEAVFE